MREGMRERMRQEIEINKAIGMLESVLWMMEFHFKGGDINKAGLLKVLQQAIDILDSKSVRIPRAK